jgi:hypothetical protein
MHDFPNFIVWRVSNYFSLYFVSLFYRDIGVVQKQVFLLTKFMFSRDTSSHHILLLTA